MAGFAAIVYLGFFGSVQADAASGSELIDVVTAVVLGGVDIFGGSGSILGVLLALILIAVLRNGMQLANLGGATQDMVIGGLLVGAILAGNVLRGVQGRGLPWTTSRGARKEVTHAETPGVPVNPNVKARQGG
jgi:rhamnose transport system permease protein